MMIRCCSGYIWFRYQRGSRSLADNIASKKLAVTAEEKAEDDEEGYEIPDEMEEIIGKNVTFIPAVDFKISGAGACEEILYLICRYILFIELGE